MGKNEEIETLALSILDDLTEGTVHLHAIMLKASKLSLLVNLPKNVEHFKKWASEIEPLEFTISSFASSMNAAVDPNVSHNSTLSITHHNSGERHGLRKKAEEATAQVAIYRSATYNYALGVYNNAKYGNLAESIFEKKRNRAEPLLRLYFADIEQRMNSIEGNINSKEPEDWANAVTSCRRLFMDLANELNPINGSKDSDEKYIDRLKDIISPKIESKSGKKLMKTMLDEMKARIEATIKKTQSSAHVYKPTLEEAEDIVLYSYMIIADIIIFHHKKIGSEEDITAITIDLEGKPKIEKSDPAKSAVKNV